MLQASVSGTRKDSLLSRHSLANCAITFGFGSVGVSKQGFAAFCSNWSFQCLPGTMQQQQQQCLS